MYCTALEVTCFTNFCIFRGYTVVYCIIIYDAVNRKATNVHVASLEGNESTKTATATE